MKRVLSLALAVIMTFAIFGSVPFTESPFAIFAKAADESALIFTLNDDGMSYSVTGCSHLEEGEIIIPAEYEGLPVTEIRGIAFQNHTKVTGITLSKNITAIESYVFNRCTNLTAINVDETNNTFSSTDGVLFNKDKTTLIKYPTGKGIEEYVIPQGISTINRYAFESCPKLEKIYIPDSVTNINASSFSDCVLLDAFIVDEENTAYSSVDGVLFNKNQTTLVRYPEAKTDIEYTIPETVTMIAESAFNDCTNLTAINTHKNIKILSKSAFNGCTGLKTFTIPAGVSAILDYVFYGCTSLAYIQIPLNAQHIGQYSFEGCSSLKSVVLVSVMNIGSGAFEDCTSLESVTFVYNLSKVGSNAFYNCNNLKYIFYNNSEESWSYNYSVDSGNTAFTNAIVHYNSLDHTYSTDWTVDFEPTCTEEGSKSHHCTCAECDSKNEITAIEPLGHDLDEGVQTKDATCDEEGILTKSCQRENCTYTEDSAIDALGHNFSIDWTVDIEPTCTEEGSKSHHCIDCDAKDSITAIDALGHDLDEGVQIKAPTCDEEGILTKSCQRENCTYTEDSFIDALGHKYSTEWTTDIEPTCTTEGSKSHHCTACGDKTDITPIEVIPHPYSTEWTVDIEPTCTSEGSKSHHCTACGDKTDITPVEIIPHPYSIEWTIDINPTCTSEGSKSHHCIACGDKADITTIEKSPHTPTEKWIHAPGFNCESGKVNYMNKHCTVCGTIVETIEVAPGHSYVDGICEKCGNCDFRYTVSGGKVTITGYTGPKGEVTIPTTLGGYPVENIKANAFSGNENIVSIIVPDDMVIGDGMLSDMPNLTTVTLGNNVTLGADLFSECPSFEKLIFSDTVTAIPDNYFTGNTTIKEVVFGNKVEVIGAAAFQKCSALKKVTIPENVDTIGELAFNQCSSLETAVIEGATTIKAEAFENCHNLYTVEIGNKTETIGTEAFIGCGALSELSLGENLKTIEQGAFAGTNNLQLVHLPEGLLTIGDSAFSMSGIQTVIIPDSVETIGNAAFGNFNIKYAQLGKGLKSVGTYAFVGFYNPTFVIPKEVTGLSEGSFILSGNTTVYYNGTSDELSQLKESGVFVENPDFISLLQANYINDIPVSSGYTDDYCYFEYPAGEIQIVDYLGFETSVTVPLSINEKPVTAINATFVPVIDILMFISDTSETTQPPTALMFSPTEVTIPETVTSIDDFAFVYCLDLETLNLPETLVSIGNAPFCSTALNSINLPASLERIGYDVFESTGIQADESNWENNVLYWDNCLIDVSSNFVGDLVVKDGTHLIADGAATGSTEIQDLHLPESLEVIGESAFSGIFNVEANIEGEETVVSDPTQYIFYKGTQEQWDDITIHNDNDIFEMYPVHFEATDHTIASEWETDITPGCTHGGTQVKKCLYCTYKITEELTATGHTLENGVCKYCTSEVVESAHYFEESIDETITLQKETAGSVTLTFSEDTYAGYIYIYDANDTLIGEYAGSDLAGETIIVQGNTVKIRLVSSGNMNEYGYYADVLWACAHTPAELVNAKEATCEEDGYTGDVYCQNCSYTFSEGEVIETTGHDVVNHFCRNCNYSDFGYKITDGQVTITGYKGEETVVDIPSTIGGYPVTALGEVFSETPVAQVIIPSGVSSIDVYCFLGAYNLTSITVAEDNPNYASEDGVLFNKEKTALITYPANKADEVYEIPEGVVEIEPYAFGYTKNLKEVVFPESTTTINEFAFCMSSLENFNYTDSIKTVGNYAFAYTDAVKFIEINENTEFIGECAFLNFGVICVLPASVENLSQVSIYSHNDMTIYYDGTEEQMAQLIADEKIVCGGNLTVIYGESVTSNTYGDFRYIETSEGEISIYDYNGNDKVVEIPSEINGKKVVDIRNTFTNLQYDFETGEIVSTPIEKIIVPDTVCELSSYAFSGNSSLYEVILPDNITHIGSDIFNETAVYYTELNWYEGGLYVGNYLVDFSSSPSTIKIKDGTKLLADDVIGHNTKEIYIPASVEYIGENIFSSSTNLTSIFYGGNQEQWEKFHISENNDAINNAVIHYNATGHTNGNWIVDILPTTTQTGSRHKECSVCGNITQEETLPATTGFEYELNNETCTLISFYDTQAEVIIPEEYNGKPVTAIGSGCFKDDMFVESVVIPETVTEIGNLAFMNCENLETVRIPESVTSIGKRAFYGFSGQIICYYGSFAHQYARDNGIDHFAITIEAIDSLTSVDYENKLIFTTMEATQQLSELIKTASVLNAESSVEVSYYGTGNIIQVKENGTIIEEYTLIVDGDLNGDSACDVLDAFFAGRVVNEHATATTAQVYAANGEASEEINEITYQRLVNKAVS